MTSHIPTSMVLIMFCLISFAGLIALVWILLKSAAAARTAAMEECEPINARIDQLLEEAKALRSYNESLTKSIERIPWFVSPNNPTWTSPSTCPTGVFWIRKAGAAGYGVLVTSITPHGISCSKDAGKESDDEDVSFTWKDLSKVGPFGGPFEYSYDRAVWHPVVPASSILRTEFIINSTPTK